MNKRLLSGYLIKDVLEINNIEMILAEMKENALGTAIKAFKALLSRQLNVLPMKLFLANISSRMENPFSILLSRKRRDGSYTGTETCSKPNIISI